MTLRTIPKRLWKQFIVFAILFAFLFSLIVVTEYLFIRRNVKQTVSSDLRTTIEEVRRALNYTGRWSLTNYRQADIPVTDFIVLGPNGLLVDMQGFVPGLVPSARPVIESADEHAMTVTTDVGEEWLVERRKVAGGLVVAGMLDAESVKNPSGVLATELKKFGSTLNDAVKVRPKDISNLVDAYAVLDEFGEVRFALGGVPLKIRLPLPPNVPNGVVYTARLEGKDYAFWSTQVPPSPAQPAGLIVAFEDISNQDAVLSLYRRFNAIVGFGAWAVVLLAVALMQVAAEISRRRQEISLEEALKAGEGPTIEFKAGIIDRTVAHTMTAFANTDSGNVFLGINNKAEVVGLDDAETPQDRDNWQQKIRGLSRNVVRPPLLVYPKFFNYQGKVVLRIFVPRGPSVAYMVENVAYIRHMTSSERAGPDDFSTILRSHQRYWG